MPEASLPSSVPMMLAPDSDREPTPAHSVSGVIVEAEVAARLRKTLCDPPLRLSIPDEM